MNRRDALQGLATAAAMPWLGGGSFERLSALGHEVRGAMSASRQLQVLDAGQAAVVEQLAEIVLPRTDTPGARDVGVTAFIDTLLHGWMDDEERREFLAGVAWVDERARAATGTAFLETEPAERLDLVARFDAEVAELLRLDGAGPPDEYVENPDGRPEPQAPGHFFYRFKQLVLTGYFTSEEGMRTLGYDSYPGRWDPCVAIDPDPGP